MMTYQEARQLNQHYQDALKQLTRTTRYRLAEQLAERDQADGRTRLIGGPRTKEQLVRELLDLDYPHEQLNEATHVLYHAPSARWSACEHCKARPATENVNTSELRRGDVVLAYGMRVRVDEIHPYVPVGAETLSWSCSGTVLNLADVLAAKIVPPSFLQSYKYDEDLPGFTVDRDDAWTVQGSTLARWDVETPRPEPQSGGPVSHEPDRRPHKPDCNGHHTGGKCA